MKATLQHRGMQDISEAKQTRPTILVTGHLLVPGKEEKSSSVSAKSVYVEVTKNARQTGFIRKGI
jgi:hypothetical protein